MKRFLCSFIVLCGLSLAHAGCGEFVRWGENGPPNGFPDAGSSDARVNVSTLQHSALAVLQQRFVTRDGEFVLFDYQSMLADPEALALLDGYRELLAQVDPIALANEQERLALFVNAYNATVIRGVLDNLPGNPGYSVEDNNFVFFSQPRVSLGGAVMSLDQLEHGAIRGDWNHAGVASASSGLLSTLMAWHQATWSGQPADPRIHAVVNCGARSCPNLIDEAPYVLLAQTMEQQLAAQTTRWLDSAKGASDQGVSSLFDWYAADFVAASGSVDAFIQANRTGGLGNVDSSTFLNYDWTLNAP